LQFRVYPTIIADSGGVAWGSLLPLKQNIRGILIPSEEERLVMQSLDFKEFLWAMGDEMTMPFQ